MKKFLGLLFVLSLLAYWIFPRSPYRYELAVCAIFKDEAPWLKEWIVYHYDVLGFEHFYLYNNDSTDNYQEVLKPFVDKGIVELIEWNSSEDHSVKDFRDKNLVHWVYYQLGAYNDCLKNRALGKAKWVAVIDIDEFIVPVEGKKSFYAQLRNAEKRHKGSLKFAWRMFGTSYIWDLAPENLMTEHLIRRAIDEHKEHQLGKCIHRPEAVDFCHVHEAGKIKAGTFHSGNLNGKFRSRQVEAAKIRIHHYWTRTEKMCQEKRGMADPKKEFVEAYNCLVDRSMEQYIPALKEAMTRY